MKRALFRASVLLLLLAAAARCKGGDSDDFLCELAVGHLADCCPGFPTESVNCVTAGDGCGAWTSVPVLSGDDSRCVLGLDCSDIVQNGICPAVLQRRDVLNSDYDVIGVSGGRVCQ